MLDWASARNDPEDGGRQWRRFEQPLYPTGIQPRMSDLVTAVMILPMPAHPPKQMLQTSRNTRSLQTLLLQVVCGVLCLCGMY